MAYELILTDAQMKNLIGNLEMQMHQNGTDFTDTTDPLASIYCAAMFGNEYMNSDEKGELEEYYETHY